MANTKKQVSKKVIKHVKKTYKKNPRIVIFLLIVIVLLFIGLTGYLYFNGYLDKYFDNNPEPNPEIPVDDGSIQDENGYYYYSLSGYESGDYYFLAKNLSGGALAGQLKQIIHQGFNPISYGDARYVLSFSDRNPQNNNESVRGIYNNAVIATTWIGSGAGAWQREHVWPNSKLGIPRVSDSSKNQGSDLHNLRAIDGINQTRSNRYFTDGSGEAVTVGSEAFYPGDEHKGDVARILFYMAIMYDDILSLTNEINNLINNPNTNYKPEGAYAGLLNVLIKWHKEDPVDEFERQRNEFIYSGIALNPQGKKINPQGNRNPFIDKPEYVHLIWEGKTITDLTKKNQSTKTKTEEVRIIYYAVFFKKEEWQY